MIVWYWRKNKNFSKNFFFSMKNIFREKILDQKIWDFVIFINISMTKSQIFLEKCFSSKYFSSKKKSFSRKFLFFLQIHAISFYVTKYGHITPNSLGGSSRIKKPIFCMILDPPKIRQRCVCTPPFHDHTFTNALVVAAARDIGVNAKLQAKPPVCALTISEAHHIFPGKLRHSNYKP